MLINGSLPGPTIIADWGDEVGTLFLLMPTTHFKHMSNEDESQWFT